MRKSGFTLVEMSVVLVIIGLIAGGIMLGQKLIRTAEVNGLIAEIEQCKSAVKAFELKYESLPGDMLDAQDYWSQCIDFGVGTECNGDGDGAVESGNESRRAFEHLSHAGMIPQTISSTLIGVSSSMEYYIEAPLFNSHIRLLDVDAAGFWPDGKFYPVTAYINMDDTAYPATDIIGIDVKFDDGRPLDGKIRIFPEELDPVTGCVDDNDDTAQWNYNGDSDFCHLYFLMDD